jgi:histidyl-tRNA synthetase
MGPPQFVVLAGPDELSKGIVTVKTLASGEQIEVPVTELPETIAALQALSQASD